MSYEIWSRYQYGAQFGQPESRLHDGLTAPQVAAELSRDSMLAPHKLLVVTDEETVLASKWLAAYNKDVR